jgi:hypothetical protein
MEIPRVNLAEIRHPRKRLAVIRKQKAILSADLASQWPGQCPWGVFAKVVQVVRGTYWLDLRQKFSNRLNEVSHG